ncbi:adaptor complexes medium subunit family protein [Cystoisospora suis]|uniref:Adaptor complexes medium subunit family protein n=1 Tax=Cystoisospora suis TaxID=483139 RepID=A0A2C6KR32_9APIC|nr:adaptor complexes medium subunit family protein [Cystoisospora suis]
MDSLFVLNNTGTFLVEKHYGVRTPRDACGPLLQRLIAAGRTDGGSDGGAGGSSSGGGGRGGSKAASLLPRVMRGARGTILLHVSHNNLLFVGVTHQEAEPLLLLELLQRMQSALAWYCGTSTTSASASLSSALLGDGGCCAEFSLTEEALRRHYSLVYVLLDEMSACGYPATVQGNVLQMLVPRPSVMEAAMKLVNGSSQVLSSLAASIGLSQNSLGGSSGIGGGGGSQGLQPSIESRAGEGMGLGSGSGEGGGISGAGSDCWWRRGNVHYASNEVYVDVLESIHATVNSDGNMVQASVTGAIQMNCRLSGLPELCLTLRRPQLLKDASFHPCVRLSRFKRDHVLSFCPPDGDFVLTQYWLCDSRFTLPLSVTGSISFPSSSTRSSSSSSSSSGFPLLGSKTKKPGGGSSDNSFSSSSLGKGSGFTPSKSRGGDSGGGGLGRLDLRLNAFCPVGKSSASSAGLGADRRTMEGVCVMIQLPTFVQGATITATSGTVRFLHTSSTLLWEVGSFAFDAPTQRAEGTLSLVPEEGKRLDVLPPCETSLVANVQFLIKNWVPSGFKLDSLDVSGINVPPYKGCRYSTVAGNVEFRIDCGGGTRL